MTVRSCTFSYLLVSTLTLGAIACGGGDESGGTAGGGASGSGGAAGSGNASGTGGAAATGGGAGTAGTGGVAGGAGQAGAAGAAGAAGTGGGTAGAAGSGAGGSGGGGPTPLPQFQMHVVDNAASGPAFVAVEDLNDDGKLDLLVAMFGQMGFSVPDGEVRAYIQGANLDTWTPQPVLPPSAGYKWPNGITVEDIDEDGDPDIFVPGGFLVCDAIPLAGPCGSLIWLENKQGSWVTHDIVASGNELFFHHVEFVDMDNDGIRDAVTVGERKPSFGASVSKVMWFKGTDGAGRFDTTPIEIGDGLGSIPTAYDLDGDGDLDLLSGEYFYANAASFAWLENPGDPTQPFTRHVIADDVGPAIQLTLVPDLYGDGVLRAIGSNHTNTLDDASAPEAAAYVLDVPAPGQVKSVGAWPKVKISEGIVSVKSPMFSPMAAPGIFGTGDIDGDSDVDVLLSGDGDPHVYWLRNMGPGQFETHILENDLSQAGGMKVVDLDGDGKNELVVTGYTANSVRVYSR